MVPSGVGTIIGNYDITNSFMSFMPAPSDIIELFL